MDAAPNPDPTRPVDLGTLLTHFGRLIEGPLTTIRDRAAGSTPEADPPTAGGSPSLDETIRGLCDELMLVTSDIAAYANLLGGPESIERHPAVTLARPSELVREVDLKFAALARSREIAWSSGVVGPDAAISLDRPFFDRLSTHVILHGLKATPSGRSVRFEIEADGPAWRWRIAGLGTERSDESMDAAYAPLDRLYTGDPRPDGTAALALLRECLARRGGSLALADGPGGRSVTITLPGTDGLPGAEHADPGPALGRIHA